MHLRACNCVGYGEQQPICIWELAIVWVMEGNNPHASESLQLCGLWRTTTHMHLRACNCAGYGEQQPTSIWQLAIVRVMAQIHLRAFNFARYGEQQPTSIWELAIVATLKPLKIQLLTAATTAGLVCVAYIVYVFHQHSCICIFNITIILNSVYGKLIE